MEEVVQSAEAGAVAPVGNADETKVTDQSVVNQLSAKELELLTENKKYRVRAQESEKKLKAIEDETLKIQQNHEERANRFSSELQTVKAEKTALLRRVSLEPALRAAGCLDMSTAIQIGKADLLMEEGGSLTGVDDFVADLKQGKPYLFSSQTPSSVNASMPNGGLKQEPKTEDLSTMSKADLMAKLRAL